MMETIKTSKKTNVLLKKQTANYTYFWLLHRPDIIIIGCFIVNLLLYEYSTNIRGANRNSF